MATHRKREAFRNDFPPTLNPSHIRILIKGVIDFHKIENLGIRLQRTLPRETLK